MRRMMSENELRGAHGTHERHGRVMRFEEATQIIAKARSDPGSFGVCWGCGGIVRTGAKQCPACHAYRFCTETEAVVAQAMLLGARPATSVLQEDLAG
jgi:hypothetical protein